jgi:N4-gp56 family major capsid protein
MGITLPYEFTAVVEAELFGEPAPNCVYHQFAMSHDDFTREPGETIRVNCPEFLTPSASPYTDRMLSSISARVSENAVQSITEERQEITLAEHLLPTPIRIQEYEAAHTIHDLASMNGSRLAEDYHRWRDAYLRDKMQGSTYQQLVGNNSLATLDLTDLLSLDEFVKASATLHTRHIPTFPDGKFICVIDPATEATLLVETKFLEATTRALASDADLFKGHIGTFANIRFVLSSNSVSVETTGATPYYVSKASMFGAAMFGYKPMGSVDVVPGVESREAWLRGYSAGPLIEVRGMPVQARINADDDFGRFSDMIWIEHSMYTALDPNPGVGKTVGTDSRFIQNIVGASILSAAV